MRHRPLISTVAAATLLLLATGLYWYFRVLEHGSRTAVDLGIVDLYTEHIPVVQYAFEELAKGRVPLWNPYQLCGTPFLAMGWSGLFYPPSALQLWLDVPTALEVLFVFHMFLGAFGMWCLARRFGIGMLGGLVSALTFVWSGWLTHHLNAPSIFESMTWMPFIVLALDGVALGRSYAWLGLIAALTCQLLLGLMEIVLHTAYLGAAFFLCRILVVGRETSWPTALRRSGIAALAALAAVCLSLPNTLPLVELVRQSSRSAGTLSLEQVSLGAIPPLAFVHGALSANDWVWVGTLPLVTLPFALSLRRQRVFAIAAIVTAGTAAALVFGGPAFEWYFRLPVVGGLFRRPMKFLDCWVFALALLAGAALTWLATESDAPGRRLWQRPAWLVVLGAATAAVLTGMVAFDIVDAWAIAMLGVLVLVGVVPAHRPRLVLVAILGTLQVANLFFTTGAEHVRPIRRPQILRLYESTLAPLAARLEGGRVYLSSAFLFLPGLTQKQGTLRRMNVAGDYEPLAPARYARFFAEVAPPTDTTTPFSGSYTLDETSNWRLMDLIGTRFYVMRASEPGERYMTAHPEEFHSESRSGPVRVFRRVTPLPRALVVPHARVLPTADDVLRTLLSPSFDPRAEVLVEAPPSSSEVEGAEPSGAPSAVTIATDTPERIVLTTSPDATGFLVVSDLYYPGWQAFIGDHEVPIVRANYLFRAVRLEPGTTEVRFEYHPQSFRLGLAIATLTLLVVTIATIVALRRAV